jgi:hypothetical protein
MAQEIVRCGNCTAPLRLDVGPIVKCTYCGVQTRLDTRACEPAEAPSGARLAEDVCFVTPSMKIPFLNANAPLPIFRTETLSTQSDNQDALNVNMQQGDAMLVSFRFPIQQRAPRGVPKIALTVRVAATGAMSVTVAEPGTTNIVDREGLMARVVG